MSTRSLAAPAALLLALALGACGEAESSSAEEAEPGGSPAATETYDGPTTECSYPASGSPAREVEPPPTEARAEGAVDATLVTSAGELELALDAEAAPCTVNSFVSLIQQDYFDDTTCHRLTTEGIYVLQCGDPTASGTGGPGYSFADEVTEKARYPAGTLAMANAGPDTNGSQFFIVYEDTELPPLYTVFGSLQGDSLEVVRKVAEAGTATGGPDGPPKTEVAIEDATLG